MEVPPSFKRLFSFPPFRVIKVFSTCTFTLPFSSVNMLGISPACHPSGFKRPCFFLKGLKCPLADIKSGGSHLPSSCICKAISDLGGSPEASSIIRTPALVSTKTALPIFSPFWFMSSASAWISFACTVENKKGQRKSPKIHNLFI